MNWHHRTVLHKDGYGDDYLTVHEFSFENGKYTGFTFTEASPRTKQEAKWIAKAFDLPPVVRVDDTTYRLTDMDGNEGPMMWPDYTEWKWLRRKVK